MKLTPSDLTRLLELAMSAAIQAGGYIQSMVGTHRKTNAKDAGDTPASQVVTEVDIESQRLILKTLDDSITEYQLGLLTEEGDDDSSRLESDYFWCIDPLDGTLPFTEQTLGYSVSIALVSRAGESLLGVIHDPAKNETYHALKGSGAWKNGLPIPSPSETDSDTLTWIMDRSMKSLKTYPELVVAMERIAIDSNRSGLKIIDHAGAALNGAWVTQYPPGVYYKFPKKSKGGGSLWDFAASACLLKEWGRPATDIWGKPLNLNQPGSTFMNQQGVIYASHRDISESVQRIFSGPFSSPS